ncbi:glycosyltransferase family 2 protein [Maridesulfovibrio bastinii]|uniref:glycosyltransferase family 2 protein n=1 Tax=Maridesulfovibrio bastinii TaxID=47157 RepID=UPI00041B03E1|nr:glycosyltransferase family 2 protein [Maridesulfovibrio bastinii]
MENKTGLMKALVVMPAYNEALSVGHVVRDLKATLDIDVLVVNDRSTDETAEVAVEAGAEVLDLCCQLGAWGAIQAGIRYGLLKGYDLCITCDADGQHDVTAIPVLIRELQNCECDVLIGSCVSRGSIARHIAWKYLRFITGLSIDDLTSGFRAYNRKAMRKVGLSRASLVDYQDVSLLLILKELGITFKEIGVCMTERKCGKSRIFNSWLAVTKYMMLSSIIALCRISK